MTGNTRVKCPKDGKYCYVHHEAETGYEIRCRHYPNLINYGGCCPDVYPEYALTVSQEKTSDQK